jgi:signal transduction histidine kinase
MKTVHKFARDLRPPLLDDLGLIPALHGHLNAFTKQTAIPVRFTAFAAVENMETDKRTVLYRVTQEAFANIAKHARASLVTMSIRRNEHLVTMVIHDNGRGFDVKRWSRAGSRSKRLGLLGMRERLEMVGGSLEIESGSHHGTTIRTQLPFEGRKTRPRTGAARRRK